MASQTAAKAMNVDSEKQMNHEGVVETKLQDLINEDGTINLPVNMSWIARNLNFTHIEEEVVKIFKVSGRDVNGSISAADSGHVMTNCGEKVIFWPVMNERMSMLIWGVGDMPAGRLEQGVTTPAKQPFSCQRTRPRFWSLCCVNTSGGDASHHTKCFFKLAVVMVFLSDTCFL